MKKFWLALAILTLPFGVSAQSSASTNPPPGGAAGYSTRDATVLSMMGWGVGLAAGIAALCALVHNDTAHSH